MIHARRRAPGMTAGIAMVVLAGAATLPGQASASGCAITSGRASTSLVWNGQPAEPVPAWTYWGDGGVRFVDCRTVAVSIVFSSVGGTPTTCVPLPANVVFPPSEQAWCFAHASVSPISTSTPPGVALIGSTVTAFFTATGIGYDNAPVTRTASCSGTFVWNHYVNDGPNMICSF